MRRSEELHFEQTTAAGHPTEEEDPNLCCYGQEIATGDFLLREGLNSRSLYVDKHYLHGVPYNAHVDVHQSY